MFDFEKLESLSRTLGCIAVHCPTLESAQSFVGALEEKYPRKRFKDDPGPQKHWDSYKENTCYNPNLNTRGGMMYCYIDYYREEGYTIIDVSDLYHLPDIGDFEASDVDMKCLFGME